MELLKHTFPTANAVRICPFLGWFTVKRRSRRVLVRGLDLGRIVYMKKSIIAALILGIICCVTALLWVSRGIERIETLYRYPIAQGSSQWSVQHRFRDESWQLGAFNKLRKSIGLKTDDSGVTLSDIQAVQQSDVPYMNIDQLAPIRSTFSDWSFVVVVFEKPMPMDSIFKFKFHMPEVLEHREKVSINGYGRSNKGGRQEFEISIDEHAHIIVAVKWDNERREMVPVDPQSIFTQ